MSNKIEYQFKDFTLGDDLFDEVNNSNDIIYLITYLLKDPKYKLYFISGISLSAKIKKFEDTNRVLYSSILDAARTGNKVVFLQEPTLLKLATHVSNNYQETLDFCCVLNTEHELNVILLVFNKANYLFFPISSRVKIFLGETLWRNGKCLPIHYSSTDFFESINWYFDEILRNFCERKGIINDLMYDGSIIRDEPYITEMIIYPELFRFFEGYNVDVQNEAHVSHGRIDFTFSHTCYELGLLNKVCVEVKLAHHKKILDAPSQLKEYIDRVGDSNKSGILIILFFGDAPGFSISKSDLERDISLAMDNPAFTGYNMRYHIIECTKKVSPSRVSS